MMMSTGRERPVSRLSPDFCWAPIEIFKPSHAAESQPASARHPLPSPGTLAGHCLHARRNSYTSALIDWQLRQQSLLISLLESIADARWMARMEIGPPVWPAAESPRETCPEWISVAQPQIRKSKLFPFPFDGFHSGADFVLFDWNKFICLFISRNK